MKKRKLKRYVIIGIITLVAALALPYFAAKFIDKFFSSRDNRIVQESLELAKKHKESAEKYYKIALEAEKKQAAAEESLRKNNEKLTEQGLVINKLNLKIEKLTRTAPDCENIKLEEIDFDEAIKHISDLCKLNAEYVDLNAAYERENEITSYVIGDLNIALKECDKAKVKYKAAADELLKAVETYEIITIPELQKPRWGFFAGVGPYFGFGRGGRSWGFAFTLAYGREINIPSVSKFIKKKKSPARGDTGL